MHRHVFAAITFPLVLLLSLASCGEMELPTAPLEGDEATDSNPQDKETTVPGTSASGEDAPAPDGPLPPLSEAIPVDAFPTPCSIWRDHVVALVTPIEDTSRNSEALVTLISLYDWPNLPSALNESSPTLATTIAQGYQEYELTNWRIPTAAEAKALKAAYTPSQSKAPVLGATASESTPSQSKNPVLEGSAFESTPPQSKGPVLGGSAFESLNALLLTLKASELHLTDGTTNVRYLCEDATRTFSFVPGTTISAAGTKATTYRLRLVKALRLKLKQ